MRLRGTAWARAARGLPPSTKKCSWVRWEVSEEEGPSALAPSGRRSPDPSSPLAAGFTGGFVGTPADMVNVRSVLPASGAAAEGRLLPACSRDAGLLPVFPASLLPQPPRGPRPGPSGDVCVWQAECCSCPSAGQPRAGPGTRGPPEAQAWGRFLVPWDRDAAGPPLGLPQQPWAGACPPPVSPPHSPPCSALQDAERRQAAGPPAAKVSGVRALGSGGLCWGPGWGGCGGVAGRSSHGEAALHQRRSGAAGSRRVGGFGSPWP